MACAKGALKLLEYRFQSNKLPSFPHRKLRHSRMVLAGIQGLSAGFPLKPCGNLISHEVQPGDISLPFKGRAGVGMGGVDAAAPPIPPPNLPLAPRDTVPAGHKGGGTCAFGGWLNIVANQVHA